MTDLVITPTDVGVDFDGLHEQVTLIAGEDIDAGEIMRVDATTGKWALADASSAALLGNQNYMAVATVKSGRTLTGFRKGLVDVGDALDALDFDDPVYVSDTPGKLADAAGTVSKVGAHVFPVWGDGTATPDKLLMVDLT